MKARPILFSALMVRALLDGRKTMTRRVIKPQPDEDGLCRDFAREGRLFDTSGREYKCPHGEPGDLLYVREAFAMATGSSILPDTPVYRVDNKGLPMFAYKWKPSIHMPRWASRLTLRVKDVRVERVQGISEKDALAEGVSRFNPVADFAMLWDSINGERKGCSWEDNPWVWVVEFEVIKANVDKVTGHGKK